MKKLEKKKLFLLYVVLIFIIFAFSATGVFLLALTTKQASPFLVGINYNFEAKYAVEIGFDKNADGFITNNEYDFIFSNYPATKLNGNFILPEIEPPNGVVFLGQNKIFVANNLLHVGSTLNIRLSNFSASGDYLTSEGAHVYAYGPALKAVATSGSVPVSTTLSNIKHLTFGLNGDIMAENISTGIISLNVETEGEIAFELNTSLENYHDFDLAATIASPETGKLTFSEALRTSTTIAVENQTFYASSVDSLLSLAAIVNKTNTTNNDASGGFDNSAAAGGVFNTLETATILLKQNIDFNGAPELPGRLAGTNFEAIGSNNSNLRFKGNFNGQDFTISNITINTTSDYQGLFGSMDGNLTNLNLTGFSISGGSSVGGAVGFLGNLATPAKSISNCDVSDSTIIGTNYVGGLVGQSQLSTLTLCKNSATVSGGSKVGGIVGYNQNISSIEKCDNFGTITATGNNAGGIVGTNENPLNSGGTATVKNCENSGIVSGLNETGGIVGYGFNTSIDGCKNLLNTTEVKGADKIGGIIGYLWNGSLASSLNNAKINGTGATGGISGWGNASTFTLCTNNGIVLGTGSVVGGVAGNGTNSTFTFCTNSGSVSGISKIAGIIGFNQNVSNIEECKNFGTITATGNNAGGIVGTNENPLNSGGTSTVKNCENSGNVSGLNEAGGIVGYGFNTSINGCKNLLKTTEVKGADKIGGIIGYLWNGSLAGSLNNAIVSGTGSFAGGISGSGTTSTFTFCTNNGNVSGASKVAGIIGFNQNVSNIEECKNFGAITATASNAGGIVGTNENSLNSGGNSTVKNCENSGNVSGQDETGGIIGYAFNTTISGCKNLLNSTQVIGADKVGGVVGLLTSSSVTGSLNFANVNAIGNLAGGISGWGNASTFSLCNNNGSVSGISKVAGIVGYNQNVSKIENCNNFGNINATGNNAAGIVGTNENPLNSGGTSTVKNCENSGNVSGQDEIGGVIGYAYNITISDCKNLLSSTIVSGANTIGGIVGFLKSSSISACNNNASVSATNIYIGGIVGFATCGDVSEISITNCTNAGVISKALNLAGESDVSVGGIAGYCSNQVIVDGCSNLAAAKVYAKSTVGGIVGKSNGTVKNCSNAGTVFSVLGLGAIVGQNNNTGIVDNCTNTKPITNIFEGTTYSNTNYYGGFVGYNAGGIIKNCTNSVTVSGHIFIAGISGCTDGGKIENCKNMTAITGEYNVGGITGKVNNATVLNCSNEAGGKIIGKTYVGGVTGDLMRTEAAKFAIIKGCNNKAEINGSGFAAGISGSIGGIVSDCYNAGVVKGIYTGDIDYYGNGSLILSSFYIGGIGGYSHYIDRVNISPNYQNPDAPSIFAEVYNCYNTAAVYAELVAGKPVWFVGGIIGYKYQGPLSGCYNTATIGSASHTAANYIGGLFGYAEGGIANCYNTGAVYATDSAGGIAGQSQYPTIANCWNTGTVNASSEKSGGIVGFSVGATIYNCYNNGVITGGAAAGGIVGFAANHADVSNSYNLNSVTAALGTGGIIGFAINASVSNCYNQGTITGTSQGIGGIIGFINTGGTTMLIASCINFGTINGNAGSYVGGIVGLMQAGTIGGSAAAVCINYGQIRSSFNSTTNYNLIGGIFGYATAGNINYAYNRGSIYSTGASSIFFYVGFNGGATQANIQTNQVRTGGNPQGLCSNTTGVTANSVTTGHSAYTAATLLTALNNWRNGNTQIRDSFSDQYGGSGIYVQLNAWISSSPWPIVNITKVVVSVPETTAATQPSEHTNLVATPELNLLLQMQQLINPATFNLHNVVFPADLGFIKI